MVRVQVYGMALLASACDGEAPKPGPAASDPPAAPGSALIDTLQEARRETACNEARMLLSAIELYQVQFDGKCPASVDTLVEARLLPDAVVDPWKHPYAIACHDDLPEVRSVGVDGKANTEDDVWVDPKASSCKP